MSKPVNYFAIGLFTLVAAGLGLAAMLIFGSSILARRTTPMLATFQGSVHGLREGAKVKAYGVDIGTVRRIMIHTDPATRETVVPVLCEIKMDELCILLGYESPEAFEQSAALEDYRAAARAMLRPESFVTGLLYIELTENTMDTDGYVLESERFAEYYAIPTVPTEMQVLLSSLQTIVQNFASADISGLVEESKGAVAELRSSLAETDFNAIERNFNSLIEDTRLLVGNPALTTVLTDMSTVLAQLNSLSSVLEERTGPVMDRLAGTLDGLETLTREARTWLDPANSLHRELIEALDQIGSAARSLRQLADFIERNPNAIISGRKTAEPQP